ncbi:helix-turn-helix domain-containing protein [Holzapfeliella sp. JNUCC 72]
MEFSEKIKLIRKYNHLTQEELANKINVSRKTVSGWENKRSTPDELTLEILEDTFDIPIKILTDDTISDIFNINDERSQKRRHIYYYLLILEAVMIFISFLSLLNVVEAPLNTVLLILNTYIINYLIEGLHKYTLTSTYIKIGFTGIIMFSFCIGLFNLFKYLQNLNVIENPIFIISGATIGTIIHIAVLILAIHILLKAAEFLKLRKYY